MNYRDMNQIEEAVRSHVERNEMYTKERMESFGMKWHLWLINEIKNALYSIQGWVDESLIEPLREKLGRGVR